MSGTAPVPARLALSALALELMTLGTPALGFTALAVSELATTAGQFVAAGYLAWTGLALLGLLGLDAWLLWRSRQSIGLAALGRVLSPDPPRLRLAPAGRVSRFALGVLLGPSALLVPLQLFAIASEERLLRLVLTGVPLALVLAHGVVEQIRSPSGAGSRSRLLATLLAACLPFAAGLAHGSSLALIGGWVSAQLALARQVPAKSQEAPASTR